MCPNRAGYQTSATSEDSQSFRCAAPEALTSHEQRITASVSESRLRETEEAVRIPHLRPRDTPSVAEGAWWGFP